MHVTRLFLAWGLVVVSVFYLGHAIAMFSTAILWGAACGLGMGSGIRKAAPERRAMSTPLPVAVALYGILLAISLLPCMLALVFEADMVAIASMAVLTVLSLGIAYRMSSVLQRTGRRG